MIDPIHEQFLLERASAGKVRHSGRTLYAHLCGTHALLREWRNSDDICTAGLFHSIYGTVRFRHKAWPLADRDTIRNLIGPPAETLVHAFCTLNRPQALFYSDYDGNNERVRALREIEAANLLEQGSVRWLQRLCDSDISESARRSLAQRLATGKAA